MVCLSVVASAIGFAFASTFQPNKTVNGSAVVSALKSGTSISKWVAAPNDTFVVDLKIDGAESVWGWSVEVNWTAGAVNLTKVEKGTFLPNALFMGSSSELWDNEKGYIEQGGIGGAFRSGVEPITDSSGILAKLTFVVVGNGTADITLSNCLLRKNDMDNIGVYAQTKNAVVRILGDSDGKIDVFTNRGGIGLGANASTFSSQELVRVYALVTHQNASVASKEVSFLITYNNTVYASRVAITNETGYAYTECRLPNVNSSAANMPGVWSIIATTSVTDLLISDTTRFFTLSSTLSSIKASQVVHRLDNFSLNFTISGSDDSTAWHEFAVTLFDNASVPIGSFNQINTLGVQSQPVNVTIFIPHIAFLGQAKAYICLLSSDGTALSPEIIVNFEIAKET